VTLLAVDGLTTQFAINGQYANAVSNASFQLNKGETVCIVGESGCGKSVMALSIMQLISSPGRIASGQVHYQNNTMTMSEDLLTYSPKQMQRIRGNRIAMIFQEPMTSLNPVFSIGNQICESLLLHQKLNKSEANEKAMDMLNKVGIAEPKKRLNEYPHQLSGGMRQRVMIAMALCCEPDILIADEPTTALDVTIQAQILDLMQELQDELGMGIVLVTHDLGVVAQMATTIIVMYAGQFVEMGTPEEIFFNAKHPYTQGLLRAIIFGKEKGNAAPLPTIPGLVPSLLDLPKGCAFADRCLHMSDDCQQSAISDDPCNMGRMVRCIHVNNGG